MEDSFRSLNHSIKFVISCVEPVFQPILYYMRLNEMLLFAVLERIMQYISLPVCVLKYLKLKKRKERERKRAFCVRSCWFVYDG